MVQEEFELVSPTVLRILSDRRSLHVVQGCSWRTSLLAAGHAKTNTLEAINKPRICVFLADILVGKVLRICIFSHVIESEINTI